MKIEVLMSAMHQTDFTLAYKSNVQSDLLIVNQCDKNDYSELTVGIHKWRMISTTERGLSKSRNMALKMPMAISVFGATTTRRFLKDMLRKYLMLTNHSLMPRPLPLMSTASIFG